MKILEMHATFGKLHEQTLKLSEGMNILSGSNESGKSTWSAFLRVMLYGISTREKSKAGFMADKEKFAPWSGKPMYGRIEFLWNGKHHTLERVAGRNGILQAAKITETESGRVLEIPEPVGETLLGIRREVFERTAFIAQAQLAVSADKGGELEKRICALTTTGEEDVSQKQVLERLEKQKRKLKYYKKGEIPDLEEEIFRVRETIKTAQDDAAQLTEHHVKIQQLQEAEAEAAHKIQILQAFSAKNELGYIHKCEEERKKLQDELREHRENQKITPAQCAQIEEKLKLYEQKEEDYTKSCEKTQRESDKLQGLSPVPSGSVAPIICAIVCALLSGAATIFAHWGVSIAVAAVVFAVSYLIASRAFFKKYGVKNKAELAAINEEYQRQVQLVAILEEERERLLKEKQTAHEMLSSVLNMIGQPSSADCAAELILQSQKHTEKEEKLTQALANADAKCEVLRVGRDINELERLAKEVSSDEMCPSEDVEQLTRKKEEARSEREQRALLFAALKERIDTRGELGALEAREGELCETLADKVRDLEAIELAIATLSDIQSEMQRKFAPSVERRAAEIFKTLTGGHFSIVRIEDAELNLTVSENDAAPPRNILELSGGTLDELYLSVRLALCEALLSSDVPIILDDAFVNFDDLRMNEALILLKEIAKERQILVFTCHTREKKFAKEHGAEYQTIS